MKYKSCRKKILRLLQKAQFFLKVIITKGEYHTENQKMSNSTKYIGTTNAHGCQSELRRIFDCIASVPLILKTYPKFQTYQGARSRNINLKNWLGLKFFGSFAQSCHRVQNFCSRKPHVTWKYPTSQEPWIFRNVCSYLWAEKIFRKSSPFRHLESWSWKVWE